MDGLEILAEVKKILPEVTVIMLSGFGDVESAVGAMKQGAFDYISKPFKVDELLNLVRKALGTQTLSKDGMIRKGADSPAGAAIAQSSLNSTSGSKSNVIKNVMIAVISAVVLGGGVFGVMKFLSGQVKSEVFTVPYSNPTSIAFDGKNLWITDWVTQSFYQHNIDKMLSMAQTYYIQDSHPTGVTFDGKYLWSSNSWESVVNKHKLDKSLTIIETYQTPGPEPSGLYWDGVYLWICDMGQGKIYQTKVTEEGLSTVEVYDSPGSNPV